MRTIIIAAGGWLLSIVVLANIALAFRPQPVRASFDADDRIQRLERQVAEQQAFIDSHTSAIQFEPAVHTFQPGDDISVEDSRAISQVVPRSFWRRH
jgi:hypothetical protein